MRSGISCWPCTTGRGRGVLEPPSVRAEVSKPRARRACMRVLFSGEAAPGFRPGSRPPFLCRQERRQRSDPCLLGPCCARAALRCSIFAAAPNSLRSLRSRRSDKRREVSRRSALTRAAPNPCAPRRLPRGPRAIRRSLREHSIHTSAPMRSEACGEGIAACVRLVQNMALTGRTLVAEA